MYEHIRLDKMEPFYIGKGKGERAYDLYRNDHHDAITDEYGHAVVIIADKLTEEEAYWLERDTIEDYVFNLGNGIDIKGHNDYDHELPHLTNMDWGGIGGKSGVPCSEEAKEKISKKNKGRKRSEEAKRKISEARRKMSEKISKAMNGEKNPMAKKVMCVTTGETFNTIKDASDHYNVSISGISLCCNIKRKSAGKLNGVRLQWKYLEDYDDNESKAV